MLSKCSVCGDPAMLEVIYARSDEVAIAYCYKHQHLLKAWLDQHRPVFPEDEVEEVRREYVSEVF